jgi:O-antigen ligase
MWIRWARSITLLYLYTLVLLFTPLKEWIYSTFSFRLMGAHLYPLDLFIFIFGFLTIFKLPRILRSARSPNRFLLQLILVYLIFNIFVLVPWSIIDGVRLPTVFRILSPRLALIQIPFFFLLLQEETQREGLFRHINFLILALFLLALFRLATGQIGHTSTGELRLFWGGVALVFGFGASLNFFRKLNYPTRLFAGVASVFGIITINHRSGYLALFVAGILGILFIRKRLNYLFILLYSSAALLIVLYFTAPVVFFDMLTRLSLVSDLTEGNAVDRLQRWQLAWMYFKTNWLLGSKLSGQMYLMALERSSPPHNFLLEVLTREGVVGLFFYLIILLKGIMLGFRNSLYSSTTLSLSISLIFYLTFCLFNTNFLHPNNVLFMTLPLAAIMAIDNILTKQATAQPIVKDGWDQ